MEEETRIYTQELVSRGRGEKGQKFGGRQVGGFPERGAGPGLHKETGEKPKKKETST